MFIQLSPATKNRLLSQPETGMGFQILDRGYNLKDARYVLVENASVARVVWDVSSDDVGIRLSRKSHILESSERRLQESINELEFVTLSHSTAVRAGLIQLKASDSRVAAADAKQEMSILDEKFLRFSSYSNDLRILSDGSLLPGTYATTYADGMEYIKTGMDAVRRYALPSSQPAINRFFLKPPERVLIRRGTVAPANEQPGGGAEVIFDNGSPKGTNYCHDTIPEGN